MPSKAIEALIAARAAKRSKSTWRDHNDVVWPVIQSCRRLKFYMPAHAALRAYVFHRDQYQCVRCGATATDVPIGYTGRDTLMTNSFTGTGDRDCLVADHILTLKAGGRSTINNLQTLCETCNRRKQKEDRAAIQVYLGSKSK